MHRSTRWRGVATALAAAAALAGCGGSATPGEMSAQTYRSLEARGDQLTPETAKDRGATDDDELAQTFVDEGGAPEPSGAQCLYAKTSYRESYRGVARFCFEGDRAVSVERNRADLDQ